MAVVIPTLRDGERTIFRTSGDKVMHLLQYFFANPGRTTEFFSEDEVSFRQIEATHETNRDELVNTVTNHLQAAIIRRLPGESVQVAVTWEDYSDDDYDAKGYKIIVHVTQNGVSLIDDKIFVVEDDAITMR